jgi:hypothetical protein
MPTRHPTGVLVDLVNRNTHKENEMRFKLFRCQLRQAARTTTVHVVGATDEHAAMVIDQYIEALELKGVLYRLERVDHTLTEEGGGDELDDILENAPAGLVSFSGAGWVSHTAPVHKLRLFASHDYRGVPIYAAAPNVGVALTLMVNTQLPNSKQVHTFKITDITDTLPEDERKNLDEVLAAGQAGIAEYDEDEGGWWVW